MTILYATVTSISGSSFYVTFLNEDTESKTPYHRLATYAPVKGDKVAILEDRYNKKICLGKVM